jgi:hypothetical protein
VGRCSTAHPPRPDPVRDSNADENQKEEEESHKPRSSCGALEKDSFPDLRAPPASGACQTARAQISHSRREIHIENARRDPAP